MRTHLACGVAICLGLTAAFAEERVWTSDDGRQITAGFIRDNGESVTLMLRGNEVTIPLERLSEADNEWITARREEIRKKNEELAALRGTMKSFPKSDSHQIPFHVYYPTTYSVENPPPMLILFCAGGNGRGMVNNFKDACEAVGWVAVGCDVLRNNLPDEEGNPLFEEVLPVIEKSVVHDPGRLYMGGMSGGAMRAFGYSAGFDRPWKGIISCGGWLGRRHDLDYPRGMTVAWINGDQDNNANAWIEQDSAVLKRRRAKTKTFHFPGGHVLAPPDVLTEALRWVEDQK